MRAFRRETRVCSIRGCSNEFTTEQRSNRTLCDMHGHQPGVDSTTIPQGIKLPTEEEIEAIVGQRMVQQASLYLAQHVPLPPIPSQIRATVLEEMGFDTPVEAVAMYHDLHLGSRIDPRITGGLAFYNDELAADRLGRWSNGILRYTQREQVTSKLTTLHLFALGDDIEGHGQIFGTQSLGMTDSVAFQVMNFVDYTSEILLRYLERYDHITVYKVHGNHGRIAAKAKDSYPPDNLELIAWTNIADRVGRILGSQGGEWSEMSPAGHRTMQGGRIDFVIASAPIMLLEILGWRFLIMHGHGIRGIQSTYTGVIDTKLRYNSILGETINFLCKAHLHESQFAEHEIGGSVIQGGCFVGPSPLSISGSRPAASIPSQELFFMHPKYGKIHHEQIHLSTVEEMRSLIEWINR